MFHYDQGLVLTDAQLAVDARRRQPRAFVSHAHGDHMARHVLALCTPETSRLYQHRLGKRPVLEMPYHEPRTFGPLQLTTLPAGHCLGSAMLLADDGHQRLLYTGDYKLVQPQSCPAAELVAADVLVMECTFGDPAYRFPPRESIVTQLVELVQLALRQGRTPVVQAYALGKAQEVTSILTSAGVPVLQVREVFEISEIYRACGVDLGPFALYLGRACEGYAIVTPPVFHRRGGGLAGVPRPTTIAVSGWGLLERGARRFAADYVVPLSDHADYDELLATVERVGAKKVYCTHGPVEFVDRLRRLGVSAHRLGVVETAPAQSWLF